MITHQHHHHSASYERRRKLVLVLIASLIMALLLATGFYLGQNAAYSGTGMDPKSYRDLQGELATVEAALKLSEAELDVQRTRHEVDRRALEMVRRDIANQKEQMAGLEEGLRFYRSLMAPGEIAQGVSLRDIELVPGREPRQFAYRIVVQQEARKHQLVKGELQAEVFGVLAGEQTGYSLTELGEAGDGDSFALQFRYFQSIEGEIRLPEGFEPQGVTVVAKTRKPKKIAVREEFSWRIQERFTHVGK